jgi:uncharacterized protein
MIDAMPDNPIETSLTDSIAKHGWACVPLLDQAACTTLAALYDEDRWFRNRVVMQRHNFGRGEYRYFAYPLPALIQTLRTALYTPLAQIANEWASISPMLGTFPATHAAYLADCHAAGQNRPTPLLLRYCEGDYNCLHQDLYGAMAFPFQATVMLSDPDRDFSGGEFVLVEQRPRAQSRAEVIRLRQGEAVIFPVNRRVVQGKRGAYRTVMRHGVSRVSDGTRHTLGIIFHDAA